MTKGAKRRNSYVTLVISAGTIATILAVHPYGWLYATICFIAVWEGTAAIHKLVDIGFTSRADNEQ